jgi:hypothetical protein
MTYTHLWITRCRNITIRLRHAHVIHMLDMRATLRREPFRGSARARKARARVIALVIGGSLFMSAAPVSGASNHVIKEEIKALAKLTLSHKQYLCHNEIIYRESRWNHRAVGNIGGTKQAYGLYQMKLKSLHTSSHIRQYWKYWYYVVHRYGVVDTKTRDANYCKALHHLKTKGWQ